MEALDYWMGELATRSVGTREKYRLYLSRFCDWLKKTPDELIKQRGEDLKNTSPKQQRAIETALKGYLARLSDAGNSTSTQQVAYAAVRSFFEMHYLPLRMRRGDYPRGESLGSRAATKEDIKKLLENARVKVKALIMFLKDTGLRVSDVVKLRFGDLAEGLEKKEEFIRLSLITKKNKIAAKTFVGPESISALNEYFEHRKKGTRRISPETITKNSPLFRTNTPKIQFITRSGVSSTIYFHGKKSSVDSKFSAHSFRKFFQTQLEAAGVNPNWIDQMIGHRLMGSRDSYSLPTDQQLREAYVKAYTHLRVYGDPNIETRITTLESQLEERNRIIEALVANGYRKSGEIESLQKDLAKIKSSTKQLEDMLQRVKELEKKLKEKL